MLFRKFKKLNETEENENQKPGEAAVVRGWLQLSLALFMWSFFT